MTDSTTVDRVTGEMEPRELRVSDAEREHVGELLQRAVSQGRITVTEFTERMDAAMAARTRGELNAVLVDLPGATLTPSGTRDVLVLDAGGLGDLKRRGYWVVSATLQVSSTMGDVTLDFTEADFTTPVTTVELRAGVGDTVLVIPHGATVDSDDVRSSVGTVKDTTVKQRHRGSQHFVVRGSAKMGDVKILHPSSWNLGPFTVHRPFRITRRRPT